MSQIVTDYISLEMVKNSLNIKNDRHDSKLLDIIFNANTEVDARLKPFAGSVPIDVDSDTFYQAKQAAARCARSLWYESLGQLDRAKYSNESYRETMKDIIAGIKAERTDQTEVVFIPGPEHLDRVHQPGNVDEYVAEEFF